MQPLVDRALEETGHEQPIRVKDTVARLLLDALQSKVPTPQRQPTAPSANVRVCMWMQMRRELQTVVKNLDLYAQWITEAIAFEQGPPFPHDGLSGVCMMMVVGLTLGCCD